MDITKQLEDIIIKYDLDSDYPLFRKWIKDGRPQNHYYIKERIIDLGQRDSLDRDGERTLEILEYYDLKSQLFYIEEKDRDCIYRKLFFISLQLRNFIRADEWFKKIYKYNGDKISDAWSEIQELLNNIRNELNKKSKEHIIMYWMDNIIEEETEGMKYIQSRKEHSIYFSQAYTTTPRTHPVANMIFCEISQMFDKGYNNREIKKENSVLLRCLETNGYNICIISGYLQNLFSDVNIKEGLRVKEACSNVYWSLWEEILNSERPTFFLVHSLIETHYPFIGTYIESNNLKSSITRYHLGAQEIDNQICFYDSAIGKKEYRIYMSDHGDWYFKLCFHIHMQIYHYNWSGVVIDKDVFSIQDTSFMLRELIQNKTIIPQKYMRKYAEVCEVAHYNKKDIESSIKKHQIYFPYYIGYVGVITAEYYYIKFETGYEWLTSKKDLREEVNMFSDVTPNYVALKNCRKLCRDIPYDYIKDEKFKYTKYVRKIFDNVSESISKMKIIIEENLKFYENGGIALRMGGWHSMHLYYMLDEKTRGKFGAIIDYDENCTGKNLELPIYKPQSKLPSNIKAILLSSYTHLSELHDEADNYYTNYDIIDIYDLMTSKGMKFNSDFVYGTADCYDVEFPFDKE